MCRWLAYSGSPLLLEQALYAPAHSLIDQSLHSKLGAEATNGDGFGVGWYDEAAKPGVFKSIEPAWNDRNLREVAGHIRSGHFFAHIRAAIGSAVQQTNCHPFRHGQWLFMHNGYVAELGTVKRDLALAVDGGALTPRRACDRGEAAPELDIDPGGCSRRHRVERRLVACAGWKATWSRSSAGWTTRRSPKPPSAGAG